MNIFMPRSAYNDAAYYTGCGTPRVRARALANLYLNIRLKSAPELLKKRNPRLYYRSIGSDVLLPPYYLIIRQ